MVAVTRQQREAQKAAAKADEEIKKAEKNEKARKRREAYKAQKAVLVPVSTEGCREVEVKVAWEERSSDKKLAQIRGTDGKLPIKLGCEGGVGFWKLDKKRLKNFIQAERDPKMKLRYLHIIKEAAKLELLWCATEACVLSNRSTV